MNKYLLKLLLVIGLISGITGCSHKKSENMDNLQQDSLSSLHVEGSKIKNHLDETVTLRGMSTHGLGWYPRYINAEALNSLKERGANVLRIAMYSDANDGYLDEPLNLDLMYIGIENAIAEKMYLIVDWHILEDQNPLEHKEEAIRFFEEISSHYQDTPNLIYEICNEPNGDTSWEDIVAYANEVIPVIRKNAPNAIVIVGTPKFSTGLSDAMENPLPYDNIMYAYHKYIDVSKDNEPEYYWLKKAVDNEFPVFVSEWGIAYGLDSFQQQLTEQELANQNDDLVLNPAYKFLDFMEANNISWCGWALSNSSEIHAAIKAECTKISHWDDEDLTPSGKLMFGYFKERKER